MRRFLVVITLILSAIFFSGCSERVESKTKYVYKTVNQNNELAAEFGKFKISQKELMKGIYADVFDLEKKIFDIKMNRLKALMLKKLMDADPRKKGLTNDQFLEKYIAPNLKVTKGDIDKFIEQRKIPKDQINEMVKGQIRKFLEMEKKKKAVEQWMAKQTAKTPVTVYFPKPQRPRFKVKVSDRDPQWGRKDAKVTIVEFSDFQCPFCAKASKILEQIKEHYGKKIRVVFKNFPLPFHSNAKGAALAALCVNEQGSDYFWKYYRKLFANQTALSKGDLERYAREIGVESKKFKECVTSKKYEPQLADDIRQAEEDLAIKSTPTFYVNGKLINGALPFETFKEVIDEELIHP